MALTKAIRIWHTTNVNLLIFAFGMSIAAYGAALLDLAEVYQTDTKAIAYTLTTRSCGSVVAGITGSLLFKYMNTQFVCILCMVVGSVAYTLMPILPSVLLLHVNSFVIGFVLADLEIGTHVWLQMMWKENCGSILQLYNFCFGLGGIVAPLIVAPFLSTVGEQSDSSLQDAAVLNSTSGEIPEGSESRIYIPYGIIGGVYAIITISMIFSYYQDRDDYRPDDKDESKDQSAIILPKILRLILITLLCAYMSVGVANEVTFASMISAFAVKNENLSFTKYEGAFLTSLFWIAFTTSRLVSFLLSLKITPSQSIFGFHVVYISASTLLLLYANTSPTVVWVGTAMFSFGISPYFGNACAWATQFIILDHSIMSYIMLSICIAIMVPTMIVGKFIEENPMVFLYVNMGFAVGLTLLAACLIKLGSHLGRKSYSAVRTSPQS